MELKLILILLRKWLWFLILGAVIGGGVAYAYSQYKTPVYRTAATAMILGTDETLSDGSRRTSTDELVRTYTQMINTTSVLQAAADRLGYPVVEKQIAVEQTPQTRIFDIVVSDQNPGRAAAIANTLIVVLIEQNDKLQVERFNISASSLSNQIEQIDLRVQGIEDEISLIKSNAREQQREGIASEIQRLRVDISNKQRELLNLTNEFTAAAAALVEPPEEGEEAAPPPAITLEQQAILTDLENEIEQLRTALTRYEQAEFDVAVKGTLDSEGDPASALRLNQLQTDLVLYQSLYSDLVSDYEATRIASLNETPNLAQIDRALVPRRPISPRPPRNVVIGVILGLMATAGVAFFIEYMDDALKSEEALTQLLRVPVLGFAAHMGKLEDKQGVFVASNPRSSFAEELRTLRTNLEFVSVDNPLKTLLVTSAEPGAGKTTIASNLAATIAQTGQKVILVDADLRRPSSHRFFGIPNLTGLTNILIHQAQIEEALQPCDVDNLYILTSGSLPPNPVELLRTEKMSNTLAELGKIADVIVIDSPPFIVADPTVLATKVDGVLMVVRYAATREAAARSMVEQLRRANANVLGTVFNGIRAGSDFGYYYQYKTNYYGTNQTAQSSQRRFPWPFRQARTG